MEQEDVQHKQEDVQYKQDHNLPIGLIGDESTLDNVSGSYVGNNYVMVGSIIGTSAAFNVMHSGLRQRS